MEFPKAIEEREERSLQPPENQLVPRSFGLMLRTMRFLARLNQDEMAEVLVENRGRFHKGSNISGSLVSRLELARVNVLNWHLETYQNWTGIPSSVIDLIAHVSAEVRDGRLDEARAIAKSVRQLCEFVEREADAISERADGDVAHDEIKEIIQHLRAEYEKQVRHWPEDARPSADQRKSDLRLIFTVVQLIREFDKDRTHAVARIRTFPEG